MKFVCTHKCQFRGVSTYVDTVLDISDEEAKDPVVKASFAPISPGEVADREEASKDERSPKRGLTANQYREKLDQLHVPYSPSAKLDELRKMYEAATGRDSRMQKPI